MFNKIIIVDKFAVLIMQNLKEIVKVPSSLMFYNEGHSKWNDVLTGVSKCKFINYEKNVIVYKVKFKAKTEFIENSSGCCTSARRNGWYDEICSHMIRQKNRF